MRIKSWMEMKSEGLFVSQLTSVYSLNRPLYLKSWERKGIYKKKLRQTLICKQVEHIEEVFSIAYCICSLIEKIMEMGMTI